MEEEACINPAAGWLLVPRIIPVRSQSSRKHGASHLSPKRISGVCVLGLESDLTVQCSSRSAPRPEHERADRKGARPPAQDGEEVRHRNSGEVQGVSSLQPISFTPAVDKQIAQILHKGNTAEVKLVRGEIVVVEIKRSVRHTEGKQNSEKS